MKLEIKEQSMLCDILKDCINSNKGINGYCKEWQNLLIKLWTTSDYFSIDTMRMLLDGIITARECIRYSDYICLCSDKYSKKLFFMFNDSEVKNNA